MLVRSSALLERVRLKTRFERAAGVGAGGAAVGESGNEPFQLSFNSSLKVDFQGSRVTSDGGLIMVRELDERLGFGELIERHLADGRGENSQLPFADLLRQSVYSRLAGYGDLKDAARLAQDPTFRLIGSKKIWERGAALTSCLQSFETTLLTQADNLGGLATLNRELIARADAVAAPRRVVLDLDSTEIPVHGRQEQSAYNGHFASTCYIRCCCSIVKAIVWPPSCGRVMRTAQRVGRNCCFPRLSLPAGDELEVQSYVQTGS